MKRSSRPAALSTRNVVVGCHTFRATGITAYMKNGGHLEIAQMIAGHETPRTTALYDRRDGEITLHEVERVAV